MRWGLTTSIIRLHYTLGFVVFLALSCDDVPDLFEPPVPQTEIDIGGAWSPDGTKIIYFRNPSEEAKSKWPCFLVR